ncbi:probable thiopurine S-methyltransferase isoform X1 [Oscarella lobularis]|uniref:probable thiopurine S-methyltransferase isoform X1 n=1 Tax=Oscarella lobularis TaxID=121494 RepID=UPI0033133DF3
MQASPLDFWAKAWADDRDTWTSSTVNPFLIKHADLLPPNEDKDNPKRILVPLCGRSPDMIWLVDKGYVVVGVELFPKGILKFFEEQKLEFEVTEVPEIPSAKLYTARDGRLLIYECNFFDLRRDVVGLFDGVYDRGSWVAIDPPDRPKYVETVKNLLRPTGTWLLLAIDIVAEGGEYKGPPFSLPFSTVSKSIPSDFSCTEVSSYLRPEMASSLKSLKKYTFDLTVVLPVIVIRSASNQ